MENHNNADDNFMECLITLLKLAFKAGETFKGSTISEKRDLINMVFWNLELKGYRLVYSLRPPFDAFVKTAKNGEWYPRPDLNRHELTLRRGEVDDVYHSITRAH